MSDSISEDDLIERYFAPLATEPGAAGLTDDVAILSADSRDVVMTADMLVAGVHFFSDDPPDTIGWKSIAVNVSDLVAKGAEPAGFLLSLALSAEFRTDSFLSAFARGLGAAANHFGCPLLGGDTVSTPGPLTLAVTALGRAPAGLIPRRSGARVGDVLAVSGTVGDGALGLIARAAERGGPRPLWLEAIGKAHVSALIDAYLRPKPPIGSLDAIRRVHASMDVTDGLAGDAAKLLSASGLGGAIDAELVPLSPAARAALAADPSLLATILTGGDDYQTLIACPPAMLPQSGFTVIGAVVAGAGLVVRRGPEILSLGAGRFQHF